MAEAPPMDPWRELLSPSFGQGSVFIKHLEADIDVGTFLKLKENAGAGLVKTNLCRLIAFQKDVDNAGHVTKVSLIVNLFDVQKPRRSNPVHDLTRHMPVAVQQGDVESIEVSSFKDICYVFSHTSLQTMKYMAQGRCDSYVSFETFDSHLPFPCSHPAFPTKTSYCRRVWDETNMFRRKMLGILCSRRSNQSEIAKSSAKVHMSKDTWTYFFRQCVNKPGVVFRTLLKPEKAHCEPVVLPGGGLKKNRLTHPRSRMVIEEPINVLCHLLGQCSVFGLRKRPSSHKEEADDLASNDRWSVPLEVTLEQYESEVHLKVRYQRYVYSVRRDGGLRTEPPEQLRRFLNRQAPALPNMYPRPDVRYGPPSIVGLNAAEDSLLALGRVYFVEGGWKKIVGIRDGGRTIMFAAYPDDEYSPVSRETALAEIRAYRLVNQPYMRDSDDSEEESM